MENESGKALENRILVFSGLGNRVLAEEIAKFLGVPLSPTLIRKFTNDNYYVQLGNSVRGKDVFIVQPISPPCSDNLMQLFFMLDIARGAGASSIHAVIPYYSYARSDKKDAPRISIGARLIADLVVAAGA
ncbi:MAG: ribose-phosphate pyrophosphokinase-like domain-containing protein, partial [Anaerolineae bacterium]|nr:ribose-phosphate pyrophosphokinase-like domain-containing protein [Anaerolineae bacterium]